MNKFNLVKALVFSLVLVVLIYPGLDKLYLYKQTNTFEDIVIAPLKFLEEGQTILSNDNKFTRYGIDYKELDLVRGSDLSIGIKNEFLPHARWVDLDKERNRVLEEKLTMLTKETKKLSNGDYSIVLYGPPTYESDIYFLIYGLKKLNNPHPKELGHTALDDYCEIFLPSTEHKCPLICRDVLRIFVKDKERCKKLISQTTEYYRDNFYKICRFDELTANIRIKRTVGANGYFISDRCENGGKLLAYYNNKSFGIDKILRILYVILIIFTFSLFKIRRIKLGLILLLIWSLLFVPLITFEESYKSDYLMNETSYAYSNSTVFALPSPLIQLEEKHSAININKATVKHIDPPLSHLTRYGGIDF